MPCTRLFIRGIVKPKKCELILTYQRMIPFIYEQKIIYNKNRTFRYQTEEDCYKTLQKIQEGFCFKCGNIENCKKFSWTMLN